MSTPDRPEPDTAAETASADAELLNTAVRATKELTRADGDPSRLRPDEIKVLVFYGCAEWEDGRLLLSAEWAESWNRWDQ